jgi:hypothetical protein
MARVEFAPDGKHWQIDKKGSIGKMYDYFVGNPEIRESLMLMPMAKFRLIGDEGKTIVVLAYDKKKREFVHLKDVV